MIDGSEKRNRQLSFELQNSHVCEKRSKSYELQYMPLHYFTVYTPLICPPSYNFCLELPCMLHVLW